MDLINKFRLSKNPRIALTGAGGKTTLMFQLAKAYQTRVICTTTTHMAQDQLKIADQHIEITGQKDFQDIDLDESADVILFTGAPVQTNKVRGPDPDTLQKIFELAELWGCPLLIEADGARKLPIKAPADHEPPIPDFVDTVIVLIGLSGLGKPLNNKWVHRPEIFSELVGLEPDAEIHSKHLAKLLISEEGGLKNIPPGAQKTLMVNQIDCFPNWKVFYDHLDDLLSCYHQVAFGVLEDKMLLEVHHRIGGIVLAAGGSTRFGKPKQLLDWKGVPLVKHAARIAMNAGLSPVIVVTGSESDKVSGALGGETLIIYNPDWQNGQSTSVKAGVESLPELVGGAVFLLVDQPLIPPGLIRLLRQKHAQSQADIICPVVENDPGNPVLFDQRVFDELSHLAGDQGGKAIFKEHTPQLVNWDDPDAQQDIDSPEDYQRILGING